MDFGDLPQISLPLPWHRQEWARLTDQFASGRLPHALLLVGVQFTGKSQLALALSRLLLCAHAEDNSNCGHCHACELSASGGHGDFRWVEPAEKSRVIKIDQVRELVRFTTTTAGFGLRKVIVLVPADSMNVNAFNALLKSLEEPAQDTHLILICHGIQRVPATIRSRCQIFSLGPPDEALCLDWLDTLTGKRHESIKLLSMAGGRPLLAQQLLYSGSADEFVRRQLGLQSLIKGSITVPQAGALWSEVDVVAFLEHLCGELQRLLRSFSRADLRTTQGRAAFYLLDEVARLHRAVGAGTNPSKQILVDALLSRFRRELGARPLGDNIQSIRRDVNV